MTVEGKTKILNCLKGCVKSISSAAVHIIKAGGIVIFPTSSIYGLAGDAMQPDVVRKIFFIKNRPLNKPISVLISGMSELRNVASVVPNHVLLLMEKFWPGNVTFIVEANKNLPKLLTAGTGKIGIRIPLNTMAISLVKCFGFPITATSANISGNPGAARIEDIESFLLNSVDLIIDGGFLGGGIGSTVIDTTKSSVRVLREGTVPKGNFIN